MLQGAHSFERQPRGERRGVILVLQLGHFTVSPSELTDVEPAHGSPSLAFRAALMSRPGVNARTFRWTDEHRYGAGARLTTAHAVVTCYQWTMFAGTAG
jgi:hypothetical protein